MQSIIRFQMWSWPCLLKTTLDGGLAEINKFERPSPSLEALFEAALFIEDKIDLKLGITLERNSCGKPFILRRLSNTEYYHNITVDNKNYIDHWMRHADMGQTRYVEFEQVILALCVPVRNDLEKLAEKLGPDCARNCLENWTFDPAQRKTPQHPT